MKKLSFSFLALFLTFCFSSQVFAGTSIIEEASEAQREIIQDVLGKNYPIKEIAVVKSVHHKGVYYVGAIFRAQGVGRVRGIWLVGGSKDSPNLVFSVDGAAFQFSGMRRASETKAAAYSHDPEAVALEKHLKE